MPGRCLNNVSLLVCHHHVGRIKWWPSTNIRTCPAVLFFRNIVTCNAYFWSKCGAPTYEHELSITCKPHCDIPYGMHVNEDDLQYYVKIIQCVIVEKQCVYDLQVILKITFPYMRSMLCSWNVLILLQCCSQLNQFVLHLLYGYTTLSVFSYCKNIDARVWPCIRAWTSAIVLHWMTLSSYMIMWYGFNS